MDEVVLFDIPSTPRCHGWSLNPWKTRMALNYKNVPYKTEWTEFPDLEPKFKELGIAPNEQGRAYTSPAIKLDRSTYIQDSAKIALELEKRYPHPSLYLDSSLLPMAYEAVTAILVIYRPISMCKVLPKLLNRRSADYISRTRTEALKKSLEEQAKGPDAEEAWKKMKGPLEDLAALIKGKGGPFMMGKTPSYADFVITSFLYYIRRIDQNDFDGMIAIDSALSDIFEACEPWFLKDD
ncbi:hypothetical protein BKA67DRAFT_639847 [Truncatella angustata]|uniref:GST N-terminal domain-containing protein n=1 Tax=Truncatella angustata TaxID=152316 RepID=A0A9P8RFK1_9PEZI|nr:uncharacterized protein BKA67DRAFT_639847 [Truncatella angustata]KAH6645098.1 hypothetical protein BKA67DRAFT_639847 [Truncatella angustata]